MRRQTQLNTTKRGKPPPTMLRESLYLFQNKYFQNTRLCNTIIQIHTQICGGTVLNCVCADPWNSIRHWWNSLRNFDPLVGSKATCKTVSCVCARPFNYFKITGKCDVFVNAVGRLEICSSLLGCQPVSRVRFHLATLKMVQIIVSVFGKLHWKPQWLCISHRCSNY